LQRNALGRDLVVSHGEAMLTSPTSEAARLSLRARRMQGFRELFATLQRKT
jgi:hypothetical protein